MTDDSGNDKSQSFRTRIATILLIGGIVLLIALVWAAIGFSSPEQMMPEKALNMLVPLIGTWIGTVLAYYFSGDNFERASRSVSQLVDKVIKDRLEKILVKDVMIKKADLTISRLPTGQDGSAVNFKTEVLDKFQGKVTRLPVFNEKDAAVLIVHQSLAFEFVAKKSIAGGGFDVTKATLKEFLDFETNRDTASKTLAFVPENATLAIAKSRMESIKGCQDVFVTDTGASDHEIRGWLTNIDISKNAEA